MRITTSSTRARLAFTLLGALGVAGLLSAGALAVSVYQNDFSNKDEFDQIVRSGGGKACERRWRQKQKVMLVKVMQGSSTCAFKTPVEGDAELPDHALGVDAKVLDETKKSARGGAFIELTVRAGGGGVGYTLRVFPERRRFQLTRGPGGGGDFPAQGKSDAIKPVGQRNRLSLVADGARVTALANRKELASVTDRDPGQVTGRKVRFAIGNAGRGDVIAVLKSVGVGVPAR